MDKQFLKIGNKWLNNRPGVIQYAEQNSDYDGRACVTVYFSDTNYVRFYLSKPEGNAIMRWLNLNSYDLMDDYAMGFESLMNGGLPKGMGIP